MKASFSSYHTHMYGKLVNLENAENIIIFMATMGAFQIHGQSPSLEQSSVVSVTQDIHLESGLHFFAIK